MSIKISELPEAINVTENDLVPIVQGGTTKKVVASKLGGTNDYEDLGNKPQINGTTLSGNKSSNALSLQTKLATDLTEDLYLIDGTAPTLTDGKYFTNGHKVYVNETEFAAFNNCIFGYEYYSDEDIYTFIKIDETGYAIINYYDGQYTTAISSQLLQNQIDTTMPQTPRNTRVPSTKLLYDKLEEKQTEINELQAENEQLLSQIPTATATGNPINVQDSSNLPPKDFAISGNTTQDGTPTPDTPQDIHVVTGDNTVKVLGKNLFDKANATVLSLNAFGSAGTEGTFSAASYQKHVYIPCSPNTTYTVTKNVSDIAVLGVFAAYDIPAVGVTYKVLYLNSTFSSGIATVTTPNEAKYLDIRINTNQITQDQIDTILNSLQIEENSAATAYEPYTEQEQLLSLGSIELAKIGDYTDRIFKDNGKWYVEKNIGKIASYNGETITTDYISTTGGLDTGATVYYVLTTPVVTEIE